MKMFIRNGEIASIVARVGYLVQAVMGLVKPQTEVFSGTSDYVLEVVFIIALLANIFCLAGTTYHRPGSLRKSRENRLLARACRDLPDSGQRYSHPCSGTELSRHPFPHRVVSLVPWICFIGYFSPAFKNPPHMGWAGAHPGLSALGVIEHLRRRDSLWAGMVGCWKLFDETIEKPKSDSQQVALLFCNQFFYL